jgi:hypothetical protein
VGQIVGNAIATLLTFISLPAALIVAGIELFKAGVEWSSGVAAKKAEAGKHALYALPGAVLLFNAPAIWTALRSALGI